MAKLNKYVRHRKIEEQDDRNRRLARLSPQGRKRVGREAMAVFCCPTTCEPYLVDSAGRESAQGQNRTQRNSLVLHHVAYLIEASPKHEKEAKKKADNTRKARAWMCRQFYDIRAFGAVMTTGTNCGQVRGPVQITFARSIDPIVPLEFSITRKSVTTEEEARKQSEKDGSITGTMGRKNTVPYALYRCHGFINPHLAKDTGFTTADLDLLWAALKGQMWEIDRSASRGLMCTRGLYVFEHASALGNAPAHELFDRIKIEQLGAEAAPRRFDDYKPCVTVNADGLPAGVTLNRLVG
jgi:CRISPR-associated protein Cas7/Csd2 subtype I-C